MSMNLSGENENKIDAAILMRKLAEENNIKVTISSIWGKENINLIKNSSKVS